LAVLRRVESSVGLPQAGGGGTGPDLGRADACRALRRGAGASRVGHGFLVDAPRRALAGLCGAIAAQAAGLAAVAMPVLAISWKMPGTSHAPSHAAIAL
jgi:hypothetical protein